MRNENDWFHLGLSVALMTCVWTFLFSRFNITNGSDDRLLSDATNFLASTTCNQPTITGDLQQANSRIPEIYMQSTKFKFTLLSRCTIRSSLKSKMHRISHGTNLYIKLFRNSAGLLEQRKPYIPLDLATHLADAQREPFQPRPACNETSIANFISSHIMSMHKTTARVERRMRQTAKNSIHTCPS